MTKSKNMAEDGKKKAPQSGKYAGRAVELGKAGEKAAATAGADTTGGAGAKADGAAGMDVRGAAREKAEDGRDGRDARIRKELQRLNRLMGSRKKDASPKIRAAQRLIENVAFMSVHLQDLQAEINEKGCTEEYQNGENQKGVKKSAAFDAYTSTFKNFMAAIKQLVDIAPDGVEDDELTSFMRGGR